MKSRESGSTYSSRVFKIMVIGMIIMFFVTLTTAVLFQYVMKTLNSTDDNLPVKYDAHYVFIADVEEEDFWNEVYMSACETAEEEHVYIEYLKDSMGVNYSNKDLFRVAINSGVDGIIYGGNSDDELTTLINKAVAEGIAVVLLQNDSDGSLRHSFVGINNYELGQVYAKEISKILGEDISAEKKVNVLVNLDMSEGASNVLTIAMEDYFMEQNPEGELPEIEIVRIDSQDVFSVEEDIRKFMLTEDLPDVIICLNSTFTQCAYQALVDLNRVGDTQIVGYFINDTILDAISRQIIYSTVSIDTKSMGESSVMAIKEYIEEGYTNSFISVKTSVIGQNEARRMINDREDSAE